MNKVSRTILEYIKDNKPYVSKVIESRKKCSNTKDFANHVGYVIMDVVSREPKFFDINRDEIDVSAIAEELFQ